MFLWFLIISTPPTDSQAGCLFLLPCRLWLFLFLSSLRRLEQTFHSSKKLQFDKLRLFFCKLRCASNYINSSLNIIQAKFSFVVFFHDFVSNAFPFMHLFRSYGSKGHMKMEEVYPLL